VSEVEEWKQKAAWELVQAFIWAVIGSRLLGYTAFEKNTYFAVILLTVLAFRFDTGTVITNGLKSVFGQISRDKDTRPD